MSSMEQTVDARMKYENICQICDKHFSRRDNMQRHMRQVHGQEPSLSGNRKIKCPNCQEAFENMESLINHVNSNHATNIETEELDFPTFGGKQMVLLIITIRNYKY